MLHVRPGLVPGVTRAAAVADLINQFRKVLIPGRNFPQGQTGRRPPPPDALFIFEVATKARPQWSFKIENTTDHEVPNSMAIEGR